MPRMTKEQKAFEIAKRMRQLRQARFIVSAGKCPDCGTKIYRNLSMTGWYQCGHLGAVGFQKEAGPHCSWQIFYDPTPDQHAELILEIPITLVDDHDKKYEAYFDSKGICRWISNDAVPFQEMLIFNKLDQDVLELCAKMRDAEMFTVLNAYKKSHRCATTQEAISAFAASTGTVVNILGRRVKL